MTPYPPYMVYPGSPTGTNWYAQAVQQIDPGTGLQVGTWQLFIGGPAVGVPQIYNPLGLYQYFPDTGTGNWFNTAASPQFPGETVQLRSP